MRYMQPLESSPCTRVHVSACAEKEKHTIENIPMLKLNKSIEDQNCACVGERYRNFVKLLAIPCCHHTGASRKHNRQQILHLIHQIIFRECALTERKQNRAMDFVRDHGQRMSGLSTTHVIPFQHNRRYPDGNNTSKIIILSLSCSEYRLATTLQKHENEIDCRICIDHHSRKRTGREDRTKKSHRLDQ